MLNLLETILSIQSESYNQTQMQQYIIETAKSYGAIVKQHKDNIYVTKGSAESYPCIVAHTDTVHKILPDANYKIVKANNLWFAYDFPNRKPTGIGGDDKVGIYIALEMVRTMDVVKAVFFRDEEVGCVGSSVADMEFFNDCRFILQCDRKGSHDFTESICGIEVITDEFKKDIEPILIKYGRKYVNGGLTDVYQLTIQNVGVCVANMSCGYFNPHTDNEVIDIDVVLDTLDMVSELMLLDKTYVNTYKPIHQFSANTVWGDYLYYNNKRYNLDDSIIDYCDVCNKKVYFHELKEVEGYYVCDECAESLV